MTQAQWHSCVDPRAMLDALGDDASDRKLRLFACAYARTGSRLKTFAEICFAQFYTAWAKPRAEIDLRAAQAELLAIRKMPPGSLVPLRFDGDPPCESLENLRIEAAESVADGLAQIADFAVPLAALDRRLVTAKTGTAYCGPSADRPAEELLMFLAAFKETGWQAAQRSIDAASHYFVGVSDVRPRRALNTDFRKPLQDQTRLLQAELLREIFGDPFEPVDYDAERLDPIVRAAARSIYDRRAYDELPYLSDALADARVVPEEIVAHLGQDRPHVRGCWALDLVAGMR